MHWKFMSKTAWLAATLTFGFGAYSLRGAMAIEPSPGWFAVLASQRELAYVAGLSLPISALIAGLLTTGPISVRRLPALATALYISAVTFVLMAFAAPLVEALIMRAALPAQVLAYEPQGWSHWWRVYESGVDAVGHTLGVSGADARPFWRSAGLSAWQPIYVAATALLTTLLGISVAGGDDKTREQRRTTGLALATVVAVLLLGGWKAARVLSLRFDVPPEGSLALLLLGPALLLSGLLIRDLSRGRAGAQ